MGGAGRTCLRGGSAGGEWARNLQTLEGEASPGIMAFCLVLVSPPPKAAPPSLSIPSPGLGPTLGTASFRAVPAFFLFPQGSPSVTSQLPKHREGERGGWGVPGPVPPSLEAPFPCPVCQRNLHGSGYSGKLYLPGVMAPFSPSASERHTEGREAGVGGSSTTSSNRIH